MLVFHADDSAIAMGAALPIKVSEIADIDCRLQYDTLYIALVAKDGRRIDVIGNRGLDGDKGWLIHAGLVQARKEMTILN